MREIEVKARVRNADALLKACEQLGITFGEAFAQDDTVYETTLPKSDPAWNIFRIRKQGDAIILTMKYVASSRSRDNHERETTIDNAEEMADMLERVGYTKGVRINKRRRVAHYQDLEICFDEVDDLGTFIEIEKLAEEEADVDAIQAELWGILLKLGVHPDDRVHKGYDTLMKAQLKAEQDKLSIKKRA